MAANILVAVHGAAITNMIFQPPFDSTTIEIIFDYRKVSDSRHGPRCSLAVPALFDCYLIIMYLVCMEQADYPNLARVTGRRYHGFIADRVDRKAATNPIDVDKVYVDSVELLRLIKVCIARASRVLGLPT